MQSTDSIVEAYECPHCGLLHKKKESYDKCVKACEAGNKAEEKRKNDAAKLKSVLDYPRLNAKSISELETLIVQASESVSDVLGVEIRNVTFDVHYCCYMPTSHDTPIGTSVCDVRTQKLKFDGFRGKIEYVVEIVNKAKARRKFYSDYPGSYVFNKGSRPNSISGINTGTGGGRGDCKDGARYCYEVDLFLEDFPLMKKELEKYQKAKEERNITVSAFNDDMYEIIEQDTVKQEMQSDLQIVEDKISVLQKEADIKRDAINHYVNKRYTEAADAYAESVYDYVRNAFPDLYKIVK